MPVTLPWSTAIDLFSCKLSQDALQVSNLTEGKMVSGTNQKMAMIFFLM
jgi:hypothetical protein